MAQLKSTTISGTLKTTGKITSGSNVTLPNGAAVRGVNAAGSDEYALCYVSTSDNGIFGSTYLDVSYYRTGGSSIYLQNAGATDINTARTLKWQYLDWDGAGTMRSVLRCGYQSDTASITFLGSSGSRWRTIYSINALSTTSDRNTKTNIQDLDDRYIQLFDLIRPVSYQRLDGDRVHTGFIAQEVEEAMEQVGLTADELAFFCKDVRVKPDPKDSNKEIPNLDENGNLQYLYSLRYEEYIAIMAEKIKRQNKKINDLESRLQVLENLLEIN